MRLHFPEFFFFFLSTCLGRRLTHASIQPAWLTRLQTAIDSSCRALCVWLSTRGGFWFTFRLCHLLFLAGGCCVSSKKNPLHSVTVAAKTAVRRCAALCQNGAWKLTGPSQLSAGEGMKDRKRVMAGKDLFDLLHYGYTNFPKQTM